MMSPFKVKFLSGLIFHTVLVVFQLFIKFVRLFQLSLDGDYLASVV